MGEKDYDEDKIVVEIIRAIGAWCVIVIWNERDGVFRKREESMRNKLIA